MTDDIYRTLQQRLDGYSIGFPATESGIELKILQKLFSKEDAAMFLAMTPKLETAQAVARRVEKPEPEVTDRLEGMAERGLLFRSRRGDAARYAAIPFVHGVFEFQVKNLDRELAEMVEEYRLAGFDGAFKSIGGMFLRTVPVQQSINAAHQVAAYDDAARMLKEKDLIVVADCICRKKKNMVGQGCGKPMEACFMFGSMAEYYIDRGMGRRVGVAEALSILKQAQDSGLVTQPATAQNPAGMCNCCGDCCGVLLAIKNSPKPAELVLSNYFAEVDRALCTGCEACVERCQMDAVGLDGEDAAVVDHDRCIGCGLCVSACPTEALQLVPKPVAQHVTPPANSAEQMRTMAKNRGLV